MKVLRLFVSSLVFIFVFASLAVAQTEKMQNSTTGKVAVINIDAFEDKETGIREVVENYDKLETEFKSIRDELKLLFEKYNGTVEEIKKLQPPPSAPYFFNCFNPTPEKIKELDKLQSEIENKQEEAKKLYDKRKVDVFADINNKIDKALKQFAKERGYALILDISILNTEAINVLVDDVTKEFIKYYNENFAKTKKQ